MSVGVAAFRSFVVHKGALWSAGRQHRWTEDVQQADQPSGFHDGHGFWAYKSLPDAYRHFGLDDSKVLGMTEHGGEIVEGERGLRSEYALLRAFIEPGRPSGLELFPREVLEAEYPSVPIIQQWQVSALIAFHGLERLPKLAPPDLMQFYRPDSAEATSQPPPRLFWASEDEGTEKGAVMLPAAASWPDAFHPLDQRLRKAVCETEDGRRYVVWTLPSGIAPDPTQLLSPLAERPERLHRHRLL